jgi:protein-tyrosine phosphatase
MAEAMLRHALPGRNVYSAGLGALIGKPADPMSVQIMQEEGIDIVPHRAQQISSSLVSRAELILVMDLEQKKYVENQYMGTRGKVFRLCESSKTDVPDPYKEGMDSFRNAHSLIAEGVKVWSGQIVQMD